jgi:hypothetical protein
LCMKGDPPSAPHNQLFLIPSKTRFNLQLNPEDSG